MLLLYLNELNWQANNNNNKTDTVVMRNLYFSKLVGSK